MKMRSWVAVVAAMAVLGPWSMANGQAVDFKVGALTISAPWSKAALRQRGAISIFFTITNAAEDDRLLAASSNLPGEIEFRALRIASGVFRSARLSSFEIFTGIQTLEPDGPQLLALRAGTLTEGSVFPLVLTFERAGIIEIEVPVLGPRAMGPP
jgi:copper(I)-binding protein